MVPMVDQYDARSSVVKNDQPLKALEANAVAKHVMATVIVTIHLKEVDQLRGLPASSGIQIIRYGSSVVPDPS